MVKRYARSAYKFFVSERRSCSYRRRAGRDEGGPPAHAMTNLRLRTSSAKALPDSATYKTSEHSQFQGMGEYRVVIDTRGRATSINVVKGLQYGLDVEAIKEIHKWKFKPAVKGTIPVSACAPIQVSFRLY